MDERPASARMTGSGLTFFLRSTRPTQQIIIHPSAPRIVGGTPQTFVDESSPSITNNFSARIFLLRALAGSRL
jgi:hypothetical protein